MRIFSRSGKFSKRIGVVKAGLGGVLVLCLALAGASDTARANSLQQLLEQVGTEYAEAYASPFIHTFGPNQNSNLYSTASIPWRGLTFGVGVKVMSTNLNEEDQTFRKVVRIEDLGVIDSRWQGESGTAFMYGPTIFGDTKTTGGIDLHTPDGIIPLAGIPGFWDTRWVPLVTPEANIGGVVGLKFTLRYLPSITYGDLGKTTYMGYGLQWSASGLLEDLPIDLMVGFFRTNLKVDYSVDPDAPAGQDQDNLIDSEANSYFLAISKSWPAMTVYGGFAIEDSEMTVTYAYQDSDFPDLNTNVEFSVEGRQTKRFTVGLTLDILLDLNLEAGFGDMSTYSAGLMFGF